MYMLMLLMPYLDGGERIGLSLAVLVFFKNNVHKKSFKDTEYLRERESWLEFAEHVIS